VAAGLEPEGQLVRSELGSSDPREMRPRYEEDAHRGIIARGMAAPSLAIGLARADTRTAVATGNVDAIRRMLDGFNRGDFAALNELDPQAELQDEPRIPGASWNFGHRGAIDWAVKLWQSFEGLSLEVSEPLEAGDRVVMRWQASGKGKRSGIDVDMRGYCAFTMREGKVRRVEFYETRDAALGTVGLTG
jgi:ketosteroid isomerase-like protein